MLLADILYKMQRMTTWNFIAT